MDKKFNISKEMLEKILSEKEMKFTYSEIEELMDSELEKEPDEIDIELVKMCSEILADKLNPLAEDEPSPEKTIFFPDDNSSGKRNVKLGRVLLVAAVVALLCAVAIPVGAKFIPGTVSDKIIDFCYDHFKIDLRGSESDVMPRSETDNIVANLKQGNFDGLKLPAALLSDDYSKEIDIHSEDNFTVAMINVNNQVDNIYGTICITLYKDRNSEQNNIIGNVSYMNNDFEQFSINDIDVLVFGDDGEIYIKYIYSNIEIEIVLNTDFCTAITIAETINL